MDTTSHTRTSRTKPATTLGIQRRRVVAGSLVAVPAMILALALMLAGATLALDSYTPGHLTPLLILGIFIFGCGTVLAGFAMLDDDQS